MERAHTYCSAQSCAPHHPEIKISKITENVSLSPCEEETLCVEKKPRETSCQTILLFKSKNGTCERY